LLGAAIERMHRRYEWRQRYSLDLATVVVLAGPGLLFALHQRRGIENTLGDIDLFGLVFAAGACAGIPIGYVLRSFLPYRGVTLGTILGLALVLGTGVVHYNRAIRDAPRSTHATALVGKSSFEWPSHGRRTGPGRTRHAPVARYLHVEWEGRSERLLVEPELWRALAPERDRVELTTYTGRLGWTVVEQIRAAP